MEVDVYTGIKPEWRKGAFDLGALWYSYPGAIPRPLGYQYVELKAGLSFSPLTNLKMTPILFWAKQGNSSGEQRISAPPTLGARKPARRTSSAGVLIVVRLMDVR